MLQCVLVSAAVVGCGRDWFDPDDPSSLAAAVLEVVRYVNSRDGGAGLKWVALSAIVVHGVLAGVHHSYNEWIFCTSVM